MTLGKLNRVDLSAASEVHIVEPHWNPMAESQAVDRVHRIGQTREVTVTRYCVRESIEEVSSPYLDACMQGCRASAWHSFPLVASLG